MEHITAENFPITYSLIHRTLEYEKTKTEERSFKAPISAMMRYEAIYQHGGIYVDFKTEGFKPMNPFLKYKIFFTDCNYVYADQPIKAVGNANIGATKGNFHYEYLLSVLIGEDTFSLTKFDTPKIVGGHVLRNLFTEEGLLQEVGFGFHLLIQRAAKQRHS